MTSDLKQKQIKSAVAFLSGGIGVLVLALLNLAQDLTGGLPGPVGQGLMFHKGIGPYSGKETLAVFAWLLAWFVLNRILVNNNIDETKIMRWTFVLYVLATLLVFPPILDLFG